MYHRKTLTKRKHPIEHNDSCSRKVRMSRKRKYHEIKSGFRSGLEERMQELLDDEQIISEYEKTAIQFIEPAKVRKYTPDFKLPSGIFIETKGRFTAEDRQKHLLVREQNPEISICFVFSNSNAKLRKGSPTSYADWCNKNNFNFFDFKDKEKLISFLRAHR